VGRRLPHTGDIGTIDPAGCLQVTDRLKDVIKTGGEWVSSLELESIISQHPAVSEVAVIGVKDDKWGERPLAMVVLKPGRRPRPTRSRPPSRNRPRPHLALRGARRDPIRRGAGAHQRRQDQQESHSRTSGLTAIANQESIA
jgi:acyl-CoA synthetase (AMP-forming)/AMP-acid ligase II